MIIYALIGLAVILLACPIVNYLIIDSKIVPFEEKCNCAGYSGGGPNPPSPPTPERTCIDGTPAGKCSNTSGYEGYKCILSGDNLIIAPDTSCNKTPPNSTTTTTTSTATTTPADHEICYNAERDGLCSGLNVLRSGLKDDCCNEWGCCCTPSSETCTPT